MRNARFPKWQSGVALVLSLLLLLVLTIIGVAAMNSTVMQERMAGNLRMQTQVFEVASEGVTRALDFYYDEAGNIDSMIGHGDGLLCGFVHSGASGTEPVDDFLAWRYPQDGSFHTVYTDQGLRLDQQMYCCRSWTRVQIDGSLVEVENPSKLFVLSRGTFLTGADGDGQQNSLARREVEVRLDEGDPGNPTCAFCVPGEVGSVGAANSNALRMHGACGPAITTGSPDGAGSFIGAIPDDRIGNYDGGITSGDMGRPWSDANDLAEFIWWIKMGLRPANPGGGQYGGYWDWASTANTYKQGQRYRFTGNRQFGVPPTNNPNDFGIPAITYFDRSVEMGGNISGHGILIVNGNLDWGGTPDFEGLLIVIGGNFTVSGGGGGGNPRGSIITTRLDVLNSDLAAVTGGNMQAALGGRQVLRYPVAEDDDGFVKMYDPDELSLTNVLGDPVEDVPPRPMLRRTNGAELVYYFDGATHRFFRPDGTEIPPGNFIGPDLNNDFRFTGELGQPWLRFQDFDPAAGVDNAPRDKFGRLIPNFVHLPNWPTNWPHESLGYDPNLWGWDVERDSEVSNRPLCANETPASDSPPFCFGASNFDWSGGGNQAFTYDCRWLQRVRHRMLCQEPLVTGTGDFPPTDYDYDDPDDSMLCEHFDWAVEYNDDVLDLNSGLDNHYAWHIWNPSCECLGITANSDMILSGWRENLGWRDDNFTACAGLPGPGNWPN